MALRSRLFKGDAKLEAAAESDNAHLLQGAKGDHVKKIQQALVQLDGAAIDVDGVYGPRTAAAVLSYKQKRSIINRTYQNQADNIVGRMTIAVMDGELLEKDQTPTERVRLEPLAPHRQLGKQRFVSTNIRFGVTGGGPLAVGAPRAEIDQVMIDLKLFETGNFRVTNGVGGTINCDQRFAILSDPTNALGVGTSLPVTRSPQTFSVRGVNPGFSIITFQKLFAPLTTLPLPIGLIVRPPQGKKIPDADFTKGNEHHHRPSGKWLEVKNDPRNAQFGTTDGGMFSAFVCTRICKNCDTPLCVVNTVIGLRFDPLPVARSHLDWYLRSGGGRDFVEDGNISTWLRVDSGIRKALQKEFNNIPDKRGIKRSHFEFLQPDYGDTDFQFSFGGIDRVDCEFDFDLDECTVWFQDRYEWHPVYKGLYVEEDGDEARVDNCVHAAFVEMQAQGARDYWMKGQATVPMRSVVNR